MRKVPLLLGLAALLAVSVALVLFLGNSSGEDRSGSARGSQTVAKPGEAPPKGATELADAGTVEAGAGPDEVAERMDVRVGSTVKAGDERVIPKVDDAGDELYGTVLGIYGVPVANANIKIEAIGDAADSIIQVLGGTTTRETVTDEKGRFRVSRPSRWEEVYVEITARGFLEFGESMDLLEEDGDFNLGVFELEAGVVLAGKVVDSEGNPIADAEVRRQDPGEEDPFRFRGFGGSDSDAKTGADGSFELDHQEVGDYVFVVEHDEYPTGRFPGTTPPPGGEDTGIVLRMAPGATIAGKIEEFPIGREHVRVSARAVNANSSDESGFSAMLEDSGFSPDGLEGDVDPAGTFRIKGLEEGKSYAIRAYTRAGFMGRTAVSEEATVRAGDLAVALTWDSGGKLTARAVDEATANAVSDVQVRYRWDDEDDDFNFSNQTRRKTFATGEITLEELRPTQGQTSLSLLLSAPGYVDLRHENIPMTDESVVDLGALRMRKAGVVRIVVTNPEGEPISRARVRLEPETGEEDEDGRGAPRGWFSLDRAPATGKTDKTGVIELPAPETPTARIEVAHSRYAGYMRESVPMPTDGTREEKITMIEGGTIEVAVVDTSGNPVPDMRISHRYPEEALEDDTARHETNRRGEVRLRHELPGMHGFRTVERSGIVEGGERKWTEVAVVDGQTTQVVLEVAARATLSGTVTEAGAPLDRATVQLLNPEKEEGEELMIEFSAQIGRFSPRGFDSSDRTNRKGHYELEDVPAGAYRLSVTHEERAAAHIVPITIRAGGNRLDVDVPVTAIEGRVVDSAGVPVEGATLKLMPMKSGASEPDEEGDLEEQAFAEFFGGGRDGAKSQADGSYRLRGVPEGRTYVVQASKDGYVAGRSDQVTVSMGQVKGGMDVQLTSGGSLRVNVVGETSPFTFLRVRWVGDEEDAPSQKVSMVRRGKVTFEGLKPGRWEVMETGEDEGQIVEISAGAETTIDMAL